MLASVVVPLEGLDLFDCLGEFLVVLLEDLLDVFGHLLLFHGQELVQVLEGFLELLSVFVLLCEQFDLLAVQLFVYVS